MSKQNKVLNKIKNALSNNQSVDTMQNAKKNPNDECYTDMQDILNELSYWAALGKFSGKNIICPCDWDIVEGENIYSITITYKNDDVEVEGNSVFKAVKSVCYDLWSDDEEPTITKIELKEDEIEDFLRDKLTCNFLRTFTQNARAWGIKSITASGYNPATDKGIKFQDIDYSKYDHCATNPPFSLFGEFMKTIVGKINFTILAPFLNRISPCVGKYLMTNEAYLGKGIHLALDFNNPTKENAYHTKSVACDWLVSFPEAQQERNNQNFMSGVEYDVYKDEYVEIPTMTMKDGTHPIRVPGQFPEDYDGWMFGGANILDKLNQDKYEWCITNAKGYLNHNKDKNPFAHKLTDTMTKNPITGKGFHGIVFRKKQKQD